MNGRKFMSFNTAVTLSLAVWLKVAKVGLTVCLLQQINFRGSCTGH